MRLPVSTPPFYVNQLYRNVCFGPAVEYGTLDFTLNCLLFLYRIYIPIHPKQAGALIYFDRTYKKIIIQFQNDCYKQVATWIDKTLNYKYIFFIVIFHIIYTVNYKLRNITLSLWVLFNKFNTLLNVTNQGFLSSLN